MALLDVLPGLPTHDPVDAGQRHAEGSAEVGLGDAALTPSLAYLNHEVGSQAGAVVALASRYGFSVYPGAGAVTCGGTPARYGIVTVVLLRPCVQVRWSHAAQRPSIAVMQHERRFGWWFMAGVQDVGDDVGLTLSPLEVESAVAEVISSAGPDPACPPLGAVVGNRATPRDFGPEPQVRRTEPSIDTLARAVRSAVCSPSPLRNGRPAHRTDKMKRHRSSLLRCHAPGCLQHRGGFVSPKLYQLPDGESRD